METKTIWTSKTVWGAIAMLLPVILKLFGVDLTDADASTAVGLAQQILDLALQLGGFIMVVIGRMKARAPATVLPK